MQSTESSNHLQIAQVRRAYLLTNSLDHVIRLPTFQEINAGRTKHCLVGILADTPGGVKRSEMRLEQMFFHVGNHT